MDQLITKAGTVLTSEKETELVAEAEAGLDPNKLVPHLDDPGDDPWGGANLESPQEAAITRISAEKLRPYMGMWVVIHEDEVIQSAQSIRELMKKLRGPEYSEKFRGSRSASLLWVPVDPSQDVPFET